MNGRSLIKDICSRGRINYDNTIKSIEEVVAKDFYKFYRDSETGGVKNFRFIKISCKNYTNTKKLIKCIKDTYNNSELRKDLDEYRFKEWMMLESSYCDSNFMNHLIIQLYHLFMIVILSLLDGYL